MQKDPVRQDLKWQKHIYSQFAPLLPSSICLTGKVPPVLEGKSQLFKLLSDVNIESRAGWTGSAGLPVIDRWYSQWRRLFSTTTGGMTYVQHPSREPNELKGAAIVKIIWWRHGGLRLKCCWVIRCPAILNLKDLGLDVASALFSCFCFVFSLAKETGSASSDCLIAFKRRKLDRSDPRQCFYFPRIYLHKDGARLPSSSQSVFAWSHSQPFPRLSQQIK